ncbi:unnamed protein product (macronuclear) [Paramecium tetraurelia]|uniref:Armadillo-type fold n=1 Tax=Paramecium tetraurelia TaxID=5888 RepID=A0DGC0_PARTE|nr:uncharacterized protein GSPATT00002216001 [Paramecium tetraurelia]CAK82087.1 unnamed protein product [Paramecium tetraurelia]|eukprot:XP_001449484.1 hypothetical protein (macronuclear) [Paramecium tetraurelia strain d4-2]
METVFQVAFQVGKKEFQEQVYFQICNQFLKGKSMGSNKFLIKKNRMCKERRRLNININNNKKVCKFQINYNRLNYQRNMNFSYNTNKNLKIKIDTKLQCQQGVQLLLIKQKSRGKKRRILKKIRIRNLRYQFNQNKMLSVKMTFQLKLIYNQKKPKSSSSSSSSSSDDEKQNFQKKKEKNVKAVITETIIQEKQKTNYNQPLQQPIIQEQDNEQLKNQFQTQQVETSQSINRQENYVFELASANTVYNQPENANTEFQPQQEVSTFYQFESQRNNNLQQFEDQQPKITLQTELIQDSQRTAAFNLEFQEPNQQIEVEYVVQEKQGELQEVKNQMIELNSQQTADIQSFQQTQQIQEQLEQRVQQRNEFEDNYYSSQVVQNDQSSLNQQPILQNQQPNVGRWQISAIADLLQALQLILQNEQNQSRLPGVLKQFRQLIQSEKDAKDCHQLDITNQLLFIYSQSSYQAYQIDVEESLLAILQYHQILNDYETLIKWSDLQIARVSINLVRILIKAKETKFMRNRMINQKDIIILVNYLEDCWDEELVSVILTCLEGYCQNSKCAQLLYQYEVINHIKKWIQRLQKECFLLIGSLCLYNFAQKDLNDQSIYLIINKSINDQSIEIKQNAYYALSCLCYQNKEVQQQLLDSDLLFIILIDLEQKSEPKLIEVTAQLLTNVLYKIEQQKVESRILISLLIRQLQTQNTLNTLKWILRCLQSLCLLRSNSLISISESIFDILKKLLQNKALLRDLLQLYSTYSAQQLLPSEQVTVIKQIIQNNKDDSVIIEKSITVLNLSVKQYSKKICTLDNLQIFTQLIEQYKQNEKVISLILILIQNLACDKDNHSTINKSVVYNALEFFQDNQQINHFSQKIKTIISNQQIQPEQIQVQMKQIILDNPADKLARGFPLLVFTSSSDTKTGNLKVLPSNELFFQENSGDIKEKFRIRQVVDMNFKPNSNSSEYRLYQGSRFFNKDLFFTIRGKYNNKFNTISGQALLIEQKQELVSILEILYDKAS